MATKGTITGTASKGFKLKIEWERKSYSIANNTSSILATLYVYNDSNAYNLTPNTAYYTIDGTKKYATFQFTTKNTWQLLGSKTITISHKADGTGTYTLKGYWYSGITSSSYTPTELSVSGTITLDTIPQYATAVQSLSSKTETTITMKWSSDSIIDQIWYSTNNGSTWTAKSVTEGSSGSYTISGLEPITTYKIKTRVRRKDSQLTTDSSALSVTTYDHPYCTDAPSFTIGNKVTLKFYNPLGRTFSFYVIANEQKINKKYTCSSTTYTGLNESDMVEGLYNSIPNATKGRYDVAVNYNNLDWLSGGNEFSIKGTETPKFGSKFTYSDGNETTKAITKDPSLIVQNASELVVSFSEATPGQGASISGYYFSLNDTSQATQTVKDVNFGEINSANDETLVMSVVDSRGLISTQTKTVKMVAHSEPTAEVTLQRKNNYEDTVYLTVNADVSNINGNNKATVQFRCKESNYSNYTTISNRETTTIEGFDKNKIFTFEIKVTDSIDATYTKSFELGKGVFPLFIDTKLNSIGINKMPTKEKVLEIDGRILGTQNQVLWSGDDKMGSSSLAIDLSEKVSEQASGIILVWSACNSSGTASNNSFNFTFIPKIHTQLHEGGGVVCRLSGGTPFKYQASKYVYVFDDRITGNDNNTATGTADSGVVYSNDLYTLRYVIGV